MRGLIKSDIFVSATGEQDLVLLVATSKVVAKHCMNSILAYLLLPISHKRWMVSPNRCVLKDSLIQNEFKFKNQHILIIVVVKIMDPCQIVL